jgi:hypothetical protein
MRKELEKQIEERKKMAMDKRIFQKAWEIGEKKGKHTEPSYRDSGETFYEDQWDFEDTILKISCHKGTFGHKNIIISHGTRLVFEGLEYQDELTITAYVPGEKWENKLDVIYKPFNRYHQKEKSEEERAERKRWGL